MDQPAEHIVSRTQPGPLAISLGIAVVVFTIATFFILTNDPLSDARMSQSQAERNEQLRQRVLNGDLGDTPTDVGMAPTGTPVIHMGEFGAPVAAKPLPSPPPSPPIDGEQSSSYYPRVVTREIVAPVATPSKITTTDGLAALDTLIADHRARHGNGR